MFDEPALSTFDPAAVEGPRQPGAGWSSSGSCERPLWPHSSASTSRSQDRFPLRRHRGLQRGGSRVERLGRSCARGRAGRDAGAGVRRCPSVAGRTDARRPRLHAALQNCEAARLARLSEGVGRANMRRAGRPGQALRPGRATAYRGHPRGGERRTREGRLVRASGGMTLSWASVPLV